MLFDSTEAWTTWLHRTLPRPTPAAGRPLALDLFAGAGGLALGFEAAGFETIGFEMDHDAAATYRSNLAGACEEVRLDVGFDFGLVPDVIVGGPPCQPFSVIGYQRGPRDSRDGFPAFLDAVRRLHPKLAIIENVRGLLYRNRDYLTAVVNELKSFGYTVDIKLLNARDYGVPQNRERVVIVASDGRWEWPAPIATSPVSAGIALGDTAQSSDSGSRYLTPSQDAYIAAYEAKSKCARPRDLHMDRPARTLTCRNFGGATSDMQRIRLPDGRRRMLSVREGARLQSFPDWYTFAGSESSVTKQIGNAVPPLLGYALGCAALDALSGSVAPATTAPIGHQLRLAFR